MTVRIVHKNSTAEDKRPTAGQLAKGEIAVNLHAAGAFLTVKDTDGNVQQVGGVKVSSASPSDPVLGTMWVDSDRNRLYVYDGSSWLLVTGAGGGGGGGGGGGDIDEVVAGSGLTGGGSSSIVTLNVGEGNGITVAANDVSVKTYHGVTADSNGVRVVPATDGGIGVSSAGVSVVGGNGIEVDSNGVNVDLDDDANRVGLEIDSTKLRAKVATKDSLGSIRIGDTLSIDVDGVVNANIDSGLSYKGNLNVTAVTNTTTSGEPAGAENGDTYTMNTAGTITSSGNDGDNTNWVDLIKDATASSTVSVGDLLVCTADGGGTDNWSLVPVGGVSYWIKSGDDLITASNTDLIRAATLASDNTTGTKVAMTDSDGRLVAHTPGTGLTVTNGQLLLDSTALSGFITAEDGGTQQSIYQSGLKLTCGPTDARRDAYQFDIGSNFTPEFQINAGSTESATFQLSSGDQGGGANTHGLYMTAGDSSNRRGQIVITGNETGNDALLAYYHTGGSAGSVPLVEIKANANVETTGNIVFKNDSPRVGTDIYGLSLTATPTANYTITLPAGAPSSSNQILESDGSNPGTLRWINTPSGASTAVWSKSGTNLSPATAGDDVYLTASDSEYLTFLGNDSRTVSIAGPSTGLAETYRMVLPGDEPAANEVLQVTSYTSNEAILRWAPLPTITTPVQSDWNVSDSTSLAFIKNKPTIPAAPVQSDWNVSDSTSLAFIKNKPTIPTTPSLEAVTAIGKYSPRNIHVGNSDAAPNVALASTGRVTAVQALSNKAWVDITDGSWNAEASNCFAVKTGTSTLASPSMGSSAESCSGLLYFEVAVSAFTGDFVFPGGSTASYPANTIVPYTVKKNSSDQFRCYMGKPTEVA